MKKYFFILAVCPFLLCCKSGQEDVPEEPAYTPPCSCGLEWPQEETIYQKEVPWDYPVKPGTEEWEQLSTIQEARDACQIPEDVLSSLSTEDLMQICMQYPFFKFIYMSSTFDGGLEHTFDSFNGLRELFRRDDALKELMKQYRCRIQNWDFFWNGKASDVEKGWYDLDLRCLEILLSHYQLPVDSKENYKDILQYLFCGYEIVYLKRLLETDFFGSEQWVTGSNSYSRAQLILKIDEQILELIPPRTPWNCIYVNGRIDKPILRTLDELTCQIIH